MPDADLLRRVEMLENTVESLRKLPADVRRLSRRVGRTESQILQLRTEMRDEFSAIRRDMATKTELTALRTELRVEIQESVAGAVRELSGAIAETRDDLMRAMREQIGEAQRQTRMLFEDVIARLKIIGERNPPLSG